MRTQLTVKHTKTTLAGYKVDEAGRSGRTGRTKDIRRRTDIFSDEQTTFKVIRQMADPVEGSPAPSLWIHHRSHRHTDSTHRVERQAYEHIASATYIEEPTDALLTLEAATLPIRGQEEKSAFGAMNGWCDAMPYVAGNYGDRYSVSS